MEKITARQMTKIVGGPFCLRHKAWRTACCVAVLTFAFCLLPCLSQADSPQDLFKAGNALYAEGKFSDAAQKYEGAVQQGLRNWMLEYNLGDAYYRAGQAGKAIL